MSIVYSRVSERASERAPLTEQSRAGGGFGPTQPLFIAPPPPPSVRAAIDCRVLNIKRRFIKIESLKPSTSYACNSSRSIPKMPSPQAASAVTASGKCRHRKRQLVQTIASAAWLDYSCLMRTRLVRRLCLKNVILFPLSICGTYLRLPPDVAT